MTLTPSRSLKVVLAWYFLTVVSCFTPVNVRGTIHRENGIGSTRIAKLAPLSVSSRPKFGIPVRLQAGSSILDDPAKNEGNGSLFELPNKRRFSLRRVVQKLLRFRIWLLRSIAALFVAACISLGVGFVEATTPAPPQTPVLARTPAQIERVDNRSAWRGISGGSDQPAASTSASTNNNEIEAGGASAVISSKKSSSKLPTALVGTAVVAATSAGFLKSLPAKNDDKTSTPEDTTDVKSKESSPEDTTATKSSDTASDGGDDNDDEKTDSMVQKVLDRAKEARLKVTPDAYLKSFENEKNMISSALNELNEKMGQSASQQEAEEEVADKVGEVEATISNPPPVLEKTPMVDTTETKIEAETADEIEVATTTDLPLMADEFVKARQQPKNKVEEEQLKQKYAQYTNLEDKAFQILVDLGMIEVARDEEDGPEAPTLIEEEKPFQ